jgi:hypothetical protein
MSAQSAKRLEAKCKDWERSIGYEVRLFCDGVEYAGVLYKVDRGAAKEQVCPLYWPVAFSLQGPYYDLSKK